jgi:hypothetical protein
MEAKKHTDANAGAPKRQSLFPQFLCFYAAERPKARGRFDGCGDGFQVERSAIEHKEASRTTLQRAACPQAVKPLALLGH